MTLTYKCLSKSGRTAYYAGLRTLIQVPISNFEGEMAPQSFEVSGAFNGPRVAMTAEERKAANKLKPKATLAERVRLAEVKAANLRKKLESTAVTA